MPVIFIILTILLLMHLCLSVIDFAIGYKKRMSFLTEKPIMKIQGWKLKAINFFALFVVSVIFGSFFILRDIIRLIKFFVSFTILTSVVNEFASNVDENKKKK